MINYWTSISAYFYITRVIYFFLVEFTYISGLIEFEWKIYQALNSFSRWYGVKQQSTNQYIPIIEQANKSSCPWKQY